MNKSEDFSAQSKRLKQFYETTGFSVNGFAQECSIPSTRTMTQIFSDGRPPSRKVLDKIITRFPALNLDWVILGYGEMIIPGMTKQPASGTSVLKSSGASFQQISDKQIETSFGINELARKVEQAMALNAQTNQLLTNKVEQMSIVLEKTIKEGMDFLVKVRELEDQRIATLDAERKEFMTTQFEAQILTIKTVLQNNMEDSKEMITNFDIERKKRNLENAEKQTKEILTCLANGKESQSKLINDNLKKLQEKLFAHADEMGANAVFEMGKNLNATLKNLKESQSKQIAEGLELGLKTFSDLVKKTTSETMTEFINFFQGNELAKKTIKELGKHTVNKKP